VGAVLICLKSFGKEGGEYGNPQTKNEVKRCKGNGGGSIDRDSQDLQSMRKKSREKRLLQRCGSKWESRGAVFRAKVSKKEYQRGTPGHLTA